MSEFIPVERLAEASESRPDGSWELLDANGFLKPAGLKAIGDRPALHYLSKGDPRSSLWAIDTNAKTAAEARKRGAAIRRNLIAKSKTPSHIPYVHDSVLYVGWEGGDVRVDPVEKKARRRATPKVADSRQAATNAIMNAIGPLLRTQKLKVMGSTVKGWAILLPFKDARLGTQKMNVKSFDEVPGKVAEMVGKLRGWGAL